MSVFCCSASHTSYLSDARIHDDTVHNGPVRYPAASSIQRCDSSPLSSDRPVPQREASSAPPSLCLSDLCRTAPTYSSACSC